ncbi:MAG: nicotinate-nucleotide adenylyltransferase [bacterium]
MSWCSAEKVRLGIFGGCFDPIHLGHLLIAEDVILKLKLHKIIFVPTFHPPHRRRPVAPYRSRVEMVRRAIAGNPFYSLSRIEENRPGPSYTVETLKQLRLVFPQTQLYFLLGYDQYRTIVWWHKPLELTKIAKVVVMSRPGIPRPPLLAGHNPRAVIFLDVIPVKLTATTIRERLAKGMSVCYLLPRAVAHYIYQNRLYLKTKTKEDQ